MTADQRDPETYSILGAGMEVHRQLGPGFREAVYHEAICREFALAGISFQTELPLQVFHKGAPLVASYRADLVCFGDIVVELKAIREVGLLEKAQLINYLKASGCSRGLILNFGERSLSCTRCINTPTHSKPQCLPSESAQSA
jgi:GxxExxY protein